MDWQCDNSCMTDLDEGLENWQDRLMSYMDIDVQELLSISDGLDHRQESYLRLMA